MLADFSRQDSLPAAISKTFDGGRLLETLPALQHDPNRPEDVLKIDADEDGIGGDDAADALRCLVATKSRAVTQRKLRGVVIVPSRQGMICRIVKLISIHADNNTKRVDQRC